MPDYIRFQQGVPEKLSLKFPTGIRKQGLSGWQMYYSLTDGRGMYVPEDVAAKIMNAGIAPNQEFWLLKHRSSGSGKNRRTLWDLYTEDPTRHEGESAIERDLRLSLTQRRAPVVPISGAEAADQPAIAEAPARLAAPPELPETPALHAHAIPPDPEIPRKPPAWATALVSQTNSIMPETRNYR